MPFLKQTYQTEKYAEWEAFPESEAGEYSFWVKIERDEMDSGIVHFTARSHEDEPVRIVLTRRERAMIDAAIELTQKLWQGEISPRDYNFGLTEIEWEIDDSVEKEGGQSR